MKTGTERDYFDGLRDAYAAQVAWVWAARRFERQLWRIHDDKYRESLERRFEDLMARSSPPPVAELEELIEDAINEIHSDWPLTPAEAADVYADRMDEYWADVREWQEDERRVAERYRDAADREGAEWSRSR